MARLLYRLGRASAHRRWTTILVWLIVIALGAVGALTLGGTLKDEFTIPDSRFQVVLDDLKDQIPDAAGGIGTVTFSAAEQFSPEQREHISQLTQEWSALDGVIHAQDPFAVQAQLDGAPAEIDAGRAELAAGREELAAAREELAAGRAEVDAGMTQLTEERARFEAMAEQLPPAAREAAEQQLTAAAAQLEAAAADIAAGEQELEAAEAELAMGERQLAHGERLANLTDGLRQVSADGSLAMTQISFSSNGGQLDQEVTAEVQRLGDELAAEGITVDYSAEITSDITSVIGPGEVVGLAVAVVVLLVMLGSVLAAGLPLLTALVGVGVGIAAALSLSATVEMTTVTPALALMLGTAVGIDYSLFILNRHRMQLADGMGMKDSIALATGTAGNAVTFAGATVIIALVALLLTGIPFLGTMGLVAAGTVAVAVLAAITLTPALLALLGPRVLPRRQARRLGTRAAEPGERGWVNRLQRRPWLAIGAAVVLAAVIASPAPQLRLGLPDGSQEPADSTAYRAFDNIRQHFGAGASGPIIAVATLPEAPVDDLAQTEEQLTLAEALHDLEGVAYVVPFGASDDGTTLAFQIAPEDGPAEASTVELVHRLEEHAADVAAQSGITLGFTGQTVANIDISEQLGEALPVYLLVVVGLSLVLLLLVFRSLWVPLLASAGFLLTVAAALGGVVAVYQLGIAGSLFGVHEPGPVLSFLPILLIGVLFGLAMDYQVFLVSGMRESFVHSGDARQAVLTGFRQSARVVTAAAIIMVSVFGGFVFAELAMIRPIGFGLALGVLIDAFLVRMTLIPAVLSLLGERAWWLPRWLDRILPNVDVEGTKLDRALSSPPTASATR